MSVSGQFSSALRRLRSQRGLSLRQFAQIVHYSPGWLSRIERGQAAPTLALARSCDDALSAEGKLLKLARLEAQSQLRPAQLPSAVAGFVGRTHALRELDATLALLTKDARLNRCRFLRIFWPPWGRSLFPTSLKRGRPSFERWWPTVTSWSCWTTPSTPSR